MDWLKKKCKNTKEYEQNWVFCYHEEEWLFTLVANVACFYRLLLHHIEAYSIYCSLFMKKIYQQNVQSPPKWLQAPVLLTTVFLPWTSTVSLSFYHSMLACFDSVLYICFITSQNMMQKFFLFLLIVSQEAFTDKHVFVLG